MIDVFSHFALGFVLGQVNASAIILILKIKHKERKKWEEWKNKLP